MRGGDRDEAASTLELGAGFREGELHSDDERLVFGGDPYLVTDLGIGRRRELSVGSGSNIPLAVEAGTSRVYGAGRDGVWAVDVAAGAGSRIAEPPDEELPDAPRESSFAWLLRLSPANDELLVLGLATKPRFALYRIPLDGRPRSRVTLDGWTGGLDGSYVHGWVCCPGFDGGARVVDLDGRFVAEVPYGFHGCAIDPSAPRIALFGESGLFLWQPTRRKLDRLRDVRCYGAAWSPDGSALYWIPRQSQLHALDVNGRSSRQWIAIRDDEYSGPEFQGYAANPIPSPDGRHVLCTMTRARAATASEWERHQEWHRQVSGGEEAPLVAGRVRFEHLTVVIDCVNRIVHPVRGWHFHNAAWLR